jgi:hypothetical protein
MPELSSASSRHALESTGGDDGLADVVAIAPTAA